MIDNSFLDKTTSILEKKTDSKNIFPTFPTELHLELTYKCNAKCIMCNLRYLDNSSELTIEDIRNLILSSKLLKKINFIVLSGGEPWLNKDFLKILEFLSEKFLKANILILTNMLVPEILFEYLKKIKEIVSMEKIFLGTSLDGINEYHDKIRNYKNAFKNLLYSLELIKNNFPGLNFCFNFTLTPENYDQILPTYEWAKTNNYNISYQVFVQKKETKKFFWNNEKINFIESQIKNIISSILNENNIKSESELLEKPWLLSKILNLYYIPRYIKNPKRYLPNCPVGYKFAMINPKGEVYFCPVHKNKIAGNIKIKNFDDIWISKETKKIMEFFNKRECHCWLSCTNGHMLADALEQNMQNIKNIF